MSLFTEPVFAVMLMAFFSGNLVPPLSLLVGWLRG